MYYGSRMPDCFAETVANPTRRVMGMDVLLNLLCVDFIAFGLTTSLPSGRRTAGGRALLLCLRQPYS